MSGPERPGDPASLISPRGLSILERIEREEGIGRPRPLFELDDAGDLVELSTGRRFRGDEIADLLVGRHRGAHRPQPEALGPRARRVVVDETPAAARFTLDVDPDGGRVLLRPSFEGEATSFTLADLEAAAWELRYFRRGDRFQRVDRALVHETRREARALGGSDDGRGFVFPASLARDVAARFGDLGRVEETELLVRFRAALDGFSAIERVPVPESLREGLALREYQRHGLDWLSFLAAHRFGGLLADDMGLGKTLQTLAVVSRWKELHGRSPSLVVCPASLVGSWRRDAEKFFPSLRVARVAGPRRQTLLSQAFLDAHVDLAVASYETARGDADALAALSFRFVVFDEAQRLKNPDAKLTQAMRRLRAECRLALSGTPVETRLHDLWSIASVVLPGYLGTEAQFERLYAATRDTAALAERMRPLLLHRKKTTPEIALELPEKIVMPARECAMTRPQRALYEQYVEAARPEIRKAVEADAFRLTLSVLESVTRLKQICGHPAVIGKAEAGSGKFDEFLELLDELLEEGENRILVFTQYVAVLGVLSAELARRRVPHLTLTGAHDADARDEAVAAFNDPSETRRVFLLSLRAGGVGLNLQAANHVIHYDRWWNPAVERQAEDRAHRLGQTKCVVVHHFRTVDSIEERIEAVLADRRDLIGDVLDEHEAVAKTLTREDLAAIFGLSAEPFAAVPAAKGGPSE